jgi:hypothetical protein
MNCNVMLLSLYPLTRSSIQEHGKRFWQIFSPTQKKLCLGILLALFHVTTLILTTLIWNIWQCSSTEVSFVCFLSSSNTSSSLSPNRPLPKPATSPILYSRCVCWFVCERPTRMSQRQPHVHMAHSVRFSLGYSKSVKAALRFLLTVSHLLSLIFHFSLWEMLLHGTFQRRCIRQICRLQQRLYGRSQCFTRHTCSCMPS